MWSDVTLPTVSTAVVLASDRSARATSFGFPSGPLVPVANKPVLFHALESLRAGGVRRVCLVVGGRTREEVASAVGDGRRFDLAVERIEAVDGMSLSGALEAAAGFLSDEPFLVHDGEAMVGEDIGALGSRFAASDLDALALTLWPNGRSDDRRRSSHRRELRAIGACFLSPSSTYESEQGSLEISPLLAGLRQSGARVGLERVEGCLPCQSGEALLSANRRALERLRPEPIGAELVDSVVDGPVVIHRTARLRRTLVRGPAVIGPRTILSHAYIGPYTSVGADVVVEGAEAEYSVILDGARLQSLGNRLESSIVGRNARITRDFRVPQAIRVVVADWAEISLA